MSLKKRCNSGGEMNEGKKGNIDVGGGGAVKTRCQIGCFFIYELAGGGELWDGYSQPL